MSWIVKAIVAEFLCWLLWHRHTSANGVFSQRCHRCGEHIQDHSL